MGAQPQAHVQQLEQVVHVQLPELLLLVQRGRRVVGVRPLDAERCSDCNALGAQS